MASVRMLPASNAAVAVGIAATLIGCGGQSASMTSGPSPTVTVSSVAVSGTTPAVGQTVQFSAIATLSNATTQNVTTQATWSSSDASIATAGSSGMVTGVGAGEADITATYQGVAGKSHVTIARPQPQTFTLMGVITDGSTRGGIEGARLEVLSGLNAGKIASTDGTGTYTMRDLVADSFRMRASADGYDSGEQGITIPANPRADFTLQRTPPRYAGVWKGSYTFTNCTNNDPPGLNPVNMCAYLLPQRYEFTFSQAGRTVVGTYRLLNEFFPNSCPCGGNYGSLDMSGTIGLDGTLTISGTGNPRGSGVAAAMTFNLRMATATTLTGTVSGNIKLGDVQRAVFTGAVTGL